MSPQGDSAFDTRRVLVGAVREGRCRPSSTRAKASGLTEKITKNFFVVGVESVRVSERYAVYARPEMLIGYQIMAKVPARVLDI